VQLLLLHDTVELPHHFKHLVLLPVPDLPLPKPTPGS
jgi:hypothetical protein